MLRNVRNFWIQVAVDGKKTDIATGPVGKTGGFRIAVDIRDDGASGTRALVIDGFADENGNLRIEAIPDSCPRSGNIEGRGPGHGFTIRARR